MVAWGVHMIFDNATRQIAPHKLTWLFALHRFLTPAYRGVLNSIGTNKRGVSSSKIRFPLIGNAMKPNLRLVYLQNRKLTAKVKGNVPLWNSLSGKE